MDEIRKRHKEQIKLHHPDRQGNPEEFKRVQAAYERACRDRKGTTT